MSDNNDYCNFEFSDRDDLSHHFDRSSVRESDFEYEDEKDIGARVDDRDQLEYDEDVDKDATGGVDQPVLQKCSRHKPGAMLEVCKVCSAALSMVRPVVTKQLLAP